jgi:hypothetical protein
MTRSNTFGRKARNQIQFWETDKPDIKDCYKKGETKKRKYFFHSS